MMLPSLRLLPTVMLCAVLLLGYKVVDLLSFGEVRNLSAISAAQATETAGALGAPEAEPRPDEQAAQSEPDTKQDKLAASQPMPVTTPATMPASQMSQAEVAVLESLSARRNTLDQRAKELDTREQLLAAAERRVEDRIEELKGLERKVKAQLGEVDRQSAEQIASVVKMYETMKPKDAARIFERLDMGVLVDMARRMDPRKMSAVLAVMDPVTAQELTVELATGHKMHTAPAIQKERPVAAPAMPPAISGEAALLPPA